MCKKEHNKISGNIQQELTQRRFAILRETCRENTHPKLQQHSFLLRTNAIPSVDLYHARYIFRATQPKKSYALLDATRNTESRTIRQGTNMRT